MRIARLYKIIQTLLHFGLDKIIPKHLIPWYLRFARNCLFWLKNNHKDKCSGLRLRLALQSLGPVWIKFGQMLSTRRDLLPEHIAQELTLLQDQVAPFPGETAQKLIEQALDIHDISELFLDFEQQPLASASIAQVHTAKLVTEDTESEDVVIKVIRPGIEKIIRSDLQLMQDLAKLVSFTIPDGKRLRPIEVIKEYKKTIIDELDLMREGTNATTLKRNFEGSDSLYVPKIHSNLSRKNILVMERIYGIPVSDIAALKEQGTDLALLAERGVEVFFTQVFRDSFFHADMHPGNVFVSRETPDNPKYIGIDCGIVGTLNKADKRYLAENFIAFFNSDYRKVAELHIDSGWVPADTNVEEFEFAIRTVCEPIFQKPLSEISFGQVLVNLFNTARRFNMEVQPQLVLLQKTLLYIEGLGRQLYPQLDLWKTAKPFLEDWVKQQMGPLAVLKQIQANLPFWGEKIPELPDLIYNNLKNTHRMSGISKNREPDQKPILLAMVSCSGFVTAALLYISEQLPTSMVVCTLSVIFFCLAWLRASK